MQKFISLIVIICFPLLSLAQLSVGVRMGMGNHGIHLEPPTLEENQVPYLRTNIGLVCVYNNENNAGLQLEINFAQKGWSEEIDTISGTFFKRQINYIEVPIYSHFEIGKRMLRPIIIAGPYIAYKLSDSFTHKGFDEHIIQENQNHYIEKSKVLDLGIKVGGGLRLNIGKHFGLFAEVHYDVDVAGGSDIFIGKPDRIGASRLTEISGSFGVLWHIIPQKKKQKKEGYVPKSNLKDYGF